MTCAVLRESPFVRSSRAEFAALLSLPCPAFLRKEAVRAIVEGAHIGNFDPDYYRSDRKDQKIDAITILTAGEQKALEKAAGEAQVVGESQNFTRDLVNEPSNRMTPTILAERAKKMCAEVGLKCEVFGAQTKSKR